MFNIIPIYFPADLLDRVEKPISMLPTFFNPEIQMDRAILLGGVHTLWSS